MTYKFSYTKTLLVLQRRIKIMHIFT